MERAYTVVNGIRTPPRKKSPPVFEHSYTVGSADDENVLSPTSNLKLLASISYITSQTQQTTRFADVKKTPTPKRSFCRDENFFGVVVEVGNEEAKSNLPAVIDFVEQPKAKLCRPLPTPTLLVAEKSNCRKDKSLGILCRRFLNTFSNDVGCIIDLDVSAKILGSGKRRMYDIINVLESLFAVDKVTKNTYRWLGLEKLPDYVHFLKMKGECDEWPRKIVAMEEALRISAEKSVMKAVRSVVDHTSNSSPFYATEDDEESESNGTNFAEDRHQRTSLINLSRRFLMLLLSTPYPHQLSMDVASALLVGSSNSAIERDQLARTRCRRMYDIANVLVGLNLVTKEHQLKYCKKIPILRYCGPTKLPQSKTIVIDANFARFRCKDDENRSPKKSFDSILQAAEVERIKLINENVMKVRKKLKTEEANLKLFSHPIVVQPSSTPSVKLNATTSIKQVQFISKSGAKFVINIKNVNGGGGSVTLKRKLDTSCS